MIYFCIQMDTLTHIVAGASIGEAVLGKKIGKKAMLWGALAGNAPDADAVMNFFISDVDSLVMHRGLSHSVFTALVMGPILGWLLWRMYTKKEADWKAWAFMITLNIFFHLFLDTCTVYGTGLLTPFTDYRYAFDTIFVADPLYTLPLIISVIALLFLSKNHHSRSTWNNTGLVLSSLYMVFAFYNHSNAINAVARTAKEKNIQSEQFQATPTLFNNILWNVVVKDSGGYWMGNYSIFDEDPTPELYFVNENSGLLADLPNQDDVEKLKKFANGYYCVTREEGKTLFNVIRFGTVNGWENPNTKLAFSFDLTPGADNSMVVQDGRIEGTKPVVLRSMWERMKGN